jgi:hypothetical protein
MPDIIIDTKLNTNGRRLLQLCKDTKCFVINHMRRGDKQFHGNLSFRKARTWVSEIDICLGSEDAVDIISDMNINQDISLPSYQTMGPWSYVFAFPIT